MNSKFMLACILLIVFSYDLNIILSSKITLFSDSAIYAEFTRFWIQGSYQYIIHPFWPPLYPLISSVIYQIYPNMEQALRIVSVLSIVVALVPLFYLMRFMSNSKIAYFFIILIPLTYHISKMSLDPLSDALALSLICFSITTTFFSIEYKSNRLFFISGIFTGLLYLTRSEGSLFFILITIFTTINIFPYIIHCRFLYLLYPLYFLFGFVIIAGIYLIITNRQLGTFSLSPKFAAQIQQNHAFALKDNSSTWAQEIWSVKEPDYHSRYYRGEIMYISNNFHPLFDLFLQRSITWKKIYLQSFPLWSIFIIIIGIIEGLKRHLKPNIFLLYMLLTTIPITIFATALPDPRYLAWSFIFIMYFFVLGIYWIINIDLIKKYSFMPTLILLISIVFLPAIKWNEISNPKLTINNINQTDFRPELIIASNWINSHAKSNPRLLMRYEGIEYYSNGVTIYMPQTSIGNLIHYAKSNSVDYIVGWSRELQGDRELERLTSETYTHPNLKQELLLNTQGGNLIIYSIN